MIVDDIPVFRDYLRNFIAWNDYGFEVCCEAKDGREALELYNIYQPDIVLTDIVMPFMNGLEFSEELLKENPEVSIILITGNSEFEYARKAVKLGVCDYIVKPFEQEELIIALLKLQDNINKVLELKNEQDELKKEHRQQILRSYIYAKKTEGAAITDHTPILTYPYFLIVTIRINLYDNKVEPEEILKWKQVLSSMLTNMLKINGKQELFYDFEGNMVTILNFKDAQSMESYEGFEYEDLIKLAKEHIGFDISIGISDFCYGTDQLKNAYYQTIQALSNSYAEHHARIYDYKRMKGEASREFYSWGLIDELNKGLEVLDYSRIEKIINKELDRIKEYENSEHGAMIYMSLLSILFSYFEKLGRNMDAMFGKDFHPYSIINNEASYIKQRQFICSCYRKAIEYQLKHRDTKTSQIAKQAKSYIEKNFGNPDLSITDLSKELLVNQTYLRKMFKEEYQMTISDYITKFRMEKAKELIKNGNSKLSVISYEIGYNDTGYFSKCFKKYFGYLPSDVINTQ